MCFYYRLLWSASKTLQSKERIFGWYVSNGSIKVKFQENSQPLYISHLEDFKKYFSWCTVCKRSTGCFVELFLSCLFMSFLIYLISVCLEISFSNSCLWNWSFQKQPQRSVFDNGSSSKTRSWEYLRGWHFVTNLVNQGLQLYWKLHKLAPSKNISMGTVT